MQRLISLYSVFSLGMLVQLDGTGIVRRCLYRNTEHDKTKIYLGEQYNHDGIPFGPVWVLDLLRAPLLPLTMVFLLSLTILDPKTLAEVQDAEADTRIKDMKSNGKFSKSLFNRLKE